MNKQLMLLASLVFVVPMCYTQDNNKDNDLDTRHMAKAANIKVNLLHKQQINEKKADKRWYENAFSSLMPTGFLMAVFGFATNIATDSSFNIIDGSNQLFVRNTAFGVMAMSLIPLLAGVCCLDKVNRLARNIRSLKNNLNYHSPEKIQKQEGVVSWEEENRLRNENAKLKNELLKKQLAKA